MKAPYKLLEDKRLAFIVNNHTVHMKEFVSMAMELLEYRLHYGRLGCTHLDADLSLITKTSPR